MPTYKNMYSVDLANGQARQVNIGTIYQGDSYANRIGAIVTENGLPVSLGGTCHGKLVQTIDGTTVLLESGVVDGNKAYCDLTPECYDSEGPVEIHIKWTNGTETAELLFASGYLKKTETDEVVDPSGRITISVETLINDIAEAESTIPEDYSILSNHVDSLTHIDLTENGYINGSGAEVDQSTYRRTGYIPIASDSLLVLDGFYVGSTSGSAYAYYFYAADKTPISGANGITTRTVVSVIPSNAAYVRFSSRTSQGETPVAYVSNHVVEEMLTLSGRVDDAQELAANAMQGTAPVFAPTAAYSAGDHVWYLGTLYRFTADHAAGAWTGTDATAVAVGTEIADLKSAVSEISIIPQNVAYVTNISETHGGVTYTKRDRNSVGLYGTSGASAQRYALFNGNNLFVTSDSGNPSKNIEAGTYTVEISGAQTSVIEARYTTSTFGNGVLLHNGDTFTVDSDFALFVLVYKNKNVGTEESPTVLSVNLFTGNTTTPTAVDVQARSEIVQARSEIAALKKIKYVSKSGNDNNSGDAPTAAYATVAKAIIESPDVIYIAKGTYNEGSIPENSAYRYKGLKIRGDNAILVMSVTGLQIRYAHVDLSGLTIDVTNASYEESYGLLLLNCTGSITDCKVIGAKGPGGFRLDGSRLTISRCVAVNCAVDGFNGHTVNTGYETECTLIDCIAYNCGDDGASIHESGKMYVIGGEYYSNAQAGLAPHDLCEFEALNVHCHHNGIGIEAVKDSLASGQTPAVGRVIGCILDHNTSYGLDVKNYTVNALGNAYASNGTAKTRAGTGATINAFVAD